MNKTTIRDGFSENILVILLRKNGLLILHYLHKENSFPENIP